MNDRQEILHQLDTEAESYVFPMLDNGYYYHGDQKLTIFRDEKRWAILLEVLQFNNHENNIDGITTIANVFGNCLTGWNDSDNFNFFASDNDVETFLYDVVNYVHYLNEKATSIKVRDTVIPIQFDKEYYTGKGIESEFENKVTPWEFLRGLIPEHSHLFWLTRQEISNKIPLDLPEFMTLSNWHHPDLALGEKPSEMETFHQLADVIVTGDKTRYNTKEINNTHWTNWPEGGAL
ncbi:hypothetical protein [Paraflavitalea sp. CAU 1676]|uniref:DUF7003 family protein n=1 Tax=Paraflavitalea sp. CAU 1676 TaxID=3032598 RepID=UPI0023DA9BCB|nr:hypothetical protein [Paraflavitalea sp. CAU 1676]MDF2189346.1 hypothetical protein [Paraflavitalea sp. CAU 1676]